VASREHPSSFHYAVAGREMFTYKKLIPNKKGMSFPSPPAGGDAQTFRRGKQRTPVFISLRRGK